MGGGRATFPPTLRLQVPVRASTSAPVIIIDIGPLDGYSPLLTFNTTNTDGSEVNAHDPVLPSNQTVPIELLENTAVGSVVMRFTATDEDVAGATTAFHSFTYSFGLDVDGLLIQRIGPFFLNASTGELTVRRFGGQCGSILTRKWSVCWDFHTAQRFVGNCYLMSTV